jgi:hypothetical protein
MDRPKQTTWATGWIEYADALEQRLERAARDVKWHTEQYADCADELKKLKREIRGRKKGAHSLADENTRLNAELNTWVSAWIKGDIRAPKGVRWWIRQLEVSDE